MRLKSHSDVYKFNYVFRDDMSLSQLMSIEPAPNATQVLLNAVSEPEPVQHDDVQIRHFNVDGIDTSIL
jgi:hypothetical protein